jgi:spore germination protein
LTIYVVKRGDTLWNLGRRFGTDPGELARINQLSDPSRLPVGLALVVPSPGPSPKLAIDVNGFAYPGIGTETLNETLPSLTFLSPFSWRAAQDGTLLPIDDQRLVTAAYAGAAAPILTAANISGAGFSSDIAHAVLTDEKAQERFTESLLAALKGRNYYGANLDFEYVYPFDRESYNQFIARLGEKLHALGYYFITTLAPKESDGQPGLLYEAHDYAAHGKYADRVIIMTYEWGYTYSPPQAVSPADRIRRVLSYAVTRIPPGKILMGFSNYGYSWSLPWRQGDAARVISNAGAADLAASVYAEIKYDEKSAAPHFNYTDAGGARREVWFEDARSARARLALAGEFGLSGISVWTINRLYRPWIAVLESMYGVEKII